MPIFGLKSTDPEALATVAEGADPTEVAGLRGEVDAVRRSQAVIEYDLDGTILNANDAYLSALGYTLSEVVGRHQRTVVDADFADSSEYRQLWDRVTRGETDRGEYKRVGRDGKEVWVLASTTPVRDDSGRVTKVVEYAADVTLLKEQQGDADRLLCMIESMPLAVMYVDRDLIVRYANPASVELLKKVQHALPIPPDQLIGTCIDQFHRNPAHQRNLLTDPKNLPLTTQIELGGETLSFTVSAIFNKEGDYIGAMANGRVMTEEVQTKQKAAEVGSTVATSVTEMVSTIDEISKNVSRTANLAQDAEGVANQTSEYVGDLGESSRKIGEVVGVIQELADQTNLLALNATIEAARAGESGRSFAVVASEVKELANETAKATQNIEQSVRQIQESITLVVESTEKITHGIGEVSTNTTTVAAAIEEQSATMASLGDTASELQALTGA